MTDFPISRPKTHVVGTHKNRLNETVLLSTQILAVVLMDKKILTFTLSKFYYLDLWYLFMV